LFGANRLVSKKIPSARAAGSKDCRLYLLQPAWLLKVSEVHSDALLSCTDLWGMPACKVVFQTFASSSSSHQQAEQHNPLCHSAVVARHHCCVSKLQQIADSLAMPRGL
jgi:hypothetical protein